MDTTASIFMPPGGSTIAGEIDAVFNYILYASTIVFAIVVFSMIFFIAKYRRRGKAGLTSSMDHNIGLEIIWTVIPTILVAIAFFMGFNAYLKLFVVPKDALEVKVTAQKWFWSFEYPEGATSINELVVPSGKAVKLLMSSKDVIHSFFVPDFRIKQDVLPNRYSMIWFEAPNVGEHNLFCAEYCGTKHSEMIGKVKVLPEREYNDWLEANSTVGEGMSLEDLGAKLYVSRACVTCHNIDGKAGNGPSFRGIFGEPEKIVGGSQAMVDENYIRKSILVPQADVVAGYQNIMPTYQGLLKERDVDALVAYIKSLKK